MRHFDEYAATPQSRSMFACEFDANFVPALTLNPFDRIR
jgi:hypothetical protein